MYGVDVPGMEGKAGMAAIVDDAAKFDLDSFVSRVKAELPSYAIPLFLRLVNTIDITGFVFRISNLHLNFFSFQELLNSENLIWFVMVSTLQTCPTLCISTTATRGAISSWTRAFMTTSYP